MTKYKELKLEYGDAVSLVRTSSDLTNITKQLAKRYGKLFEQHHRFRNLGLYTKWLDQIINKLARRLEMVISYDFAATYESPGGWRAAIFDNSPGVGRHRALIASETVYKTLEEAQKAAKQWARKECVKYKAEVFRMKDTYPHEFYLVYAPAKCPASKKSVPDRKKRRSRLDK